VGDMERIQVLGEPLDGVTASGFQLPAGRASHLLGRVPSPIVRALMRGLAARPVVLLDRCVGCAECERICPVGAAKVIDRKARIDRALCVRCMCCHEVCRFGAIRPVRGGLAGAMDRLAGHQHSPKKA